MIIIRPLIRVLSKIIELPKGSYLDPTTLGSGDPDGTNFLRGDGTWSTPTVDGYVPYVGATEDVDLGEWELKAGQIEFDQSPTGTTGTAIMRWNDTTGVTETTLKGGSVLLKNGVDLVARVVNKVTPNATLTKAAYQAVRVSGAQGQRLAVAYAQANNDNNSADTIGLVAETIATNQEGFIITVGQLEDINTTGSLQGETWADGDVLYLSPTTAGSLTNIKPTGLTGHIVVMGYVEYAHAIHGKIYVKIMNGWELDELHNVYINPATLADNNLLQYDSATSLWKNESLATAGIQSTLVSGTSIKTINSTSLLGSGDVAVQPTLVSGTSIKTINGTTLLGSGDITVGGGITVGTTAVTSGTIGRVFFQGTGNVVQQDAGFIFDSTAKTLTNYGKGALSSNTSFGALALSGNTTGTNNTAFGNGALQFAGSGANNTAIGFYALNNAAQGTFTAAANIGIGYYAGAYIISGQNNIAIGYSAGGTLTSGSRNTMIGAAGVATNSTNNNVVISDGAGNNALWKDANNFVGIGHNPTSGTLAAKLDVKAQGALSTDIAFRVRNSANTFNLFEIAGNGTVWARGGGNVQFNTAFGQEALDANTTGTFNTAFGWQALTTASTGSFNTAFGLQALANVSTGSSNVAIGSEAGESITGSGNVAIGSLSMNNATATGGNNVCVGIQTGNNISSGSANVFIGSQSAVTGVITGTSNVGIGNQTLVNLTSGEKNVSIGFLAGSALTTGTKNTLIGAISGTTTLSNNIIVADGDGNIGIKKDANHNVILGNEIALATNATNGFTYIPTCAGVPTGTPSAVTGKAPIVIDSTNNKMYIYSGGAWVALN